MYFKVSCISILYKNKSLLLKNQNLLKRLTQTYLLAMTTLGCSRSTEPLPKTTAAVSLTGAYQAHTDTEAVKSHTTINTFTQQENPAISKVVKSGLYSNGIRNTAICTVWLAIVSLILGTFVVH